MLTVWLETRKPVDYVSRNSFVVYISIDVYFLFFCACDKYIPSSNKYHSLFNIYTTKLSYSTTPCLKDSMAVLNGRKLHISNCQRVNIDPFNSLIPNSTINTDLSNICTANLESCHNCVHKNMIVCFHKLIQTYRLCNCRDRDNWYLGKQFLRKNIMYKCSFCIPEKGYRYIGGTRMNFQVRLNNHLNSFNHKKTLFNTL